MIYVALAGIDLRAAFDVVDIELLICCHPLGFAIPWDVSFYPIMRIKRLVL